ncbi:hypothetical protein NPIL_554711, partial [Nephila pilipes]
MTPEKLKKFSLKKDNKFRINTDKDRKVTVDSTLLARVPARSVDQNKDTRDAVNEEKLRWGGVAE